MTRESRKSIYVQIDIRAPIQRVWELTQTPELHQQWDLRFTEIRYLPRPDPAQPQRFLYATRIKFGLEIRGEGETVGSRDLAGGSRSSALKFWSDDSKSFIRTGSGYWKYIPLGDGQVRFLTGYDYEVRFGAFGRVADRCIFRPLMGWATAWSFDRLRLWIEEGIPPAVALWQSAANTIARLAIVFVWLYQGAIPKLMFHHPDELKMLQNAGISHASAARLAIGWMEVALGLVLLLAWRSRWPLWLTVLLMPLTTLGVAISSPGFLVAAFNPVVLNACVFALAVIALLQSIDSPSAHRCLRRPPKEAS